MSLEDKAKELYPMEDWIQTDTIPNFRYHDLQHERRLAYTLGAKQALKDMMAEAEIFCNQTIIKHPDIKPFRSGQECTADHLRLHLKNFAEDLGK